MYINKLIYSEYKGKAQEWILKECNFKKINLIVGINSTGKTRLLNIINGFKRIFLNKDTILNSNYETYFTENEDNYKYEYRSNDLKILHESLYMNDKCLFERDSNGEGKIFTQTISKNLEFKVPNTLSIIGLKRDEKQYPFLESLYNWVSHLSYYRFGSSLNKGTLGGKLDETLSEESLHSTQTLMILSYSLKNYGEEFKQDIINDMEMIGYEIEDIGLENPDGVAIKGEALIDLKKIRVLFVKEKSIKCKINQLSMSQGMYRALVLIIELNYHKFNLNNNKNRKINTVLIDDIGEGLDYDRSKKLINLIIHKSKEIDIQIIMSTNDRFVMNNIPLEHWIILERNKNICTTLDYENSKDKFEKFELTGLSNFDFFSSKYYEGE